MILVAAPFFTSSGLNGFSRCTQCVDELASNGGMRGLHPHSHPRGFEAVCLLGKIVARYPTIIPISQIAANLVNNAEDSARTARIDSAQR